MSEQFKKRVQKSISQTFSPQQMDNLKIFLQTYNQDHEYPKGYSVLIDNEIVISRTDDVELFDDYKSYVTDNMQTVEVRLYHGASPNFNSRKFTNTVIEVAPTLNFPAPSHEMIPSSTQHALDKMQWQHEKEWLEEKLRRKSKKLRRLQGEQDEKEESPNSEGWLNGLEKVGNMVSGFLGGNQTPVQAPSQPIAGIEVEEVEDDPQLQLCDKMYRTLKEKTQPDMLVQIIQTWIKIAKRGDLKDQINDLLNS